MKKEKKVSMLKLITLFMSASVFAIIGISLPPTINRINGLQTTAIYGYFASYIIAIVLFWYIMKDYSLWKKERKKGDD
jgi:hypothetical protein